VSFYWSEADPHHGGTVPVALTEPLNPYRSAMRGTLRAPVRCIGLSGEVGGAVCCTLYQQRPSPCREVEPWDRHGQPDEKCRKARAAHGLPPLAARPETPPRQPSEA
jgi:Fe-S-cluster containining protein